MNTTNQSQNSTPTAFQTRSPVGNAKERAAKLTAYIRQENKQQKNTGPATLTPIMTPEKLKELIEQNVHWLRGNLSLVNTTVHDELTTKIKNVNEELTTKIENNENSIKKVNEELTTKIENSITKVNDELTKKIENNENSIKNVNDELTAKIENNENSIKNVNEELTKVNAELTTKIENNENSIKNVNEELTAKIENNENSITTMSYDVSMLVSFNTYNMFNSYHPSFVSILKSMGQEVTLDINKPQEEVLQSLTIEDINEYFVNNNSISEQIRNKSEIRIPDNSKPIYERDSSGAYTLKYFISSDIDCVTGANIDLGGGTSFNLGVAPNGDHIASSGYLYDISNECIFGTSSI